ncbi:MAG: FAD:protein FMN transferase [Candidatus Moranbacteria bacterium]|nr:FAD:protein FMN transferase [Candidatus Moranbacteria bacterium]
MNTDILCEIQFLPKEEALATQCLATVFAMFRTFEARYSRFQKNNELWQLNHSERMALSEEFFDLLVRAQDFHTKTNGLFDPSILSALEQEGYSGATTETFNAGGVSFTTLKLDHATLTVTKPSNLRVDLGGIGKGYIVDQVATFLTRHFDNFLVDAGGDIFAAGRNQKANYPYWAVAVEHPQTGQDIALLLLHGMAVATSGSNRRHWQKNGEHKHHLIDPASQKSAVSDILSVTVIAPDTTTADVFAKTLFIAGSKKGQALAKQLALPAIFVTEAGTAIINHEAQKYVWKT